MKIALAFAFSLLLFALSASGDSSRNYISGDEFHSIGKAIYSGELNWPANKKNENMAKVRYSPAHSNLKYSNERRGKGDLYATWIFSEESATAEGIMSTPLKLVMDARLDPGASIGLHQHDDTEEVYYLLEGALTVTTISADGQSQNTEDLLVGDAHHIAFGESHYCTAGSDGARFITVAVGRE